MRGGVFRAALGTGPSRAGVAPLPAEPLLPEPLLAVDRLRLVAAGQERPLVDGVSLTVGAGEVAALVGESGSGKTLTALSLLRLLPPGVAVAAGAIRFAGEDVLAMRAARLNRLRGGGIGMIFQQPLAMLDPTAPVGSQVAEAVSLHTGLTRRQAWARAVELLAEVGIPAPAERARAYAHQLSGGMAQRVMIAAALAGDPRLLIADEPTTALDVTVQLQILQLLRRERIRRGLAILLISHDLSVVAALADRVAVMRGGSLVEAGVTADVLRRPRHGYTQALVQAAFATAVAVPAAAAEAPPLVRLDGVSKHYPVRDSHGCRLLVRSVDAVSLDIREGEVLGLVGESGCGKSTLARLLLRMTRPSAGSIHIAGQDLFAVVGPALCDLRRQVQLVFQDPVGALDPRMRLGDSLLAPLDQNRIGASRAERRRHMRDMAEAVGLDEAILERRPGACSGGQLQRAVIARALLMGPRLLVCDEPTSALDATIRTQVLELLIDLRRRFGLTLLLISHDLRVVRQLCDRIAVMYLGEIVEVADRDRLFAAPGHPYTRALIASTLLEGGGLPEQALSGEPPSPLAPPAGCRFHTRCPLAEPRCAAEPPDLVAAGPAQSVRCHRFQPEPHALAGGTSGALTAGCPATAARLERKLP